MKKLLALLFGLSISTNSIAQPDGDFVTISIEDGLSKTEKRVREAAVWISDGAGHMDRDWETIMLIIFS